MRRGAPFFSAPGADKGLPVSSFLVDHALSIINSTDEQSFPSKRMEIKSLIDIYGRDLSERIFEAFFLSKIREHSLFSILYMEEVFKSLPGAHRNMYSRVSTMSGYDPEPLFEALKKHSFEFTNVESESEAIEKRDFVVKAYSILSKDSSLESKVISELAVLDPANLTEESQAVISDARKRFKELSQFLSDQFMNHFLVDKRTGEHLESFDFDEILKTENDILVTIHKIPNVKYIVPEKEDLDLGNLSFDWGLFKSTFKDASLLEVLFEYKWDCFELKYLVIRGILESDPQALYSEKFSLKVNETVKKILIGTKEYESFVAGEFFWSNVRLFSVLDKIERTLGIDIITRTYTPCIAEFPYIVLHLVFSELPAGKPNSDVIVRMVSRAFSKISENTPEDDDNIVPFFAWLFEVNSDLVERGLINLWTTDPSRLYWIVSVVQVLKKFLDLMNHGPVPFSFWISLVGFELECLNLEKWLSSRFESTPELFDKLVDYLVGLVKNAKFSEMELKLWEGPGMRVVIKTLFEAQKRHDFSPDKLQNLLDTLEESGSRIFRLENGEHRHVSVADPSIVLDEVDSQLVESSANTIFEQYFSEQLSDQQLESKLRELKESPQLLEREVFECVTFHLFRELQFMDKFPTRVLKKLGHMVGFLLLHDMVKKGQLDTSLRYIIKSVKSDKLYHFGEAALHVILPKIFSWPDFASDVSEALRNHHPQIAAKLFGTTRPHSPPRRDAKSAAASASSRSVSAAPARASPHTSPRTSPRRVEPISRGRTKEAHKTTKNPAAGDPSVSFAHSLRDRLLGMLNELSVAGGGDSYEFPFLQKLNQSQNVEFLLNPNAMRTVISYMAMLNSSNVAYTVSVIMKMGQTKTYWLWFSEIFVTDIESKAANVSMYSEMFRYFSQYSRDIMVIIKNRIYERALGHMLSDTAPARTQIVNLGRFMALNDLATGLPIRELLIYSYVFGKLHTFVPFFASLYSVNVSNLDPALVAFLLRVAGLGFISEDVSEQVMMFRDHLMVQFFRIPEMEIDLSEYRIIVRPEDDRDVDMSKFDRVVHSKYFSPSVCRPIAGMADVKDGARGASDVDDGMVSDFAERAESLFDLKIRDYSSYSHSLTEVLKEILDKEISDLALGMLPKIITQSTRASLYFTRKDFSASKETSGFEFDYSLYLTKAMFTLQFFDAYRGVVPVYINKALQMSGVRSAGASLVEIILEDVYEDNVEEIDRLVDEILVLNIRRVIEDDDISVTVPANVLRSMPKYLKPPPPYRSIYLKPYNPNIMFDDERCVEQFREWLEEASDVMNAIDLDDTEKQREKMKEMFQNLIVILYESANPDKILEVILNVLIKHIFELYSERRRILERSDSNGDVENSQEAKLNRFRLSFLEYSIINLYESSLEDPFIPELISDLFLRRAGSGDLDSELLSKFFMDGLIDISVFDNYLSSEMFRSVDQFILVINILIVLQERYDGKPVDILSRVREKFLAAIKMYSDKIGEEHLGRLLELERKVNGRKD